MALIYISFRLFFEIAQDRETDLRFHLKAIVFLHDAAEAYLVGCERMPFFVPSLPQG